MKKLITTIFSGALALTLAVSAFAATTPAQTLGELTKRTPESIIEERNNGKRLFTIADEAGVSKQFSEKMAELRKEALERAVDNGRITKEKADEILKDFETCTELGLNGIVDSAKRKEILDKAVKDGKITQEKADELLNGRINAGIGMGMVAGKGKGCGMGAGRRAGGMGCGLGQGNGSCPALQN